MRGIPTVGFLSHVQKDLAVAAREAGCDRIVARSAFTRDLPRILAGDTPGTIDEAGVG
jgi:phosphoketolase